MIHYQGALKCSGVVKYAHVKCFLLGGWFFVWCLCDDTPEVSSAGEFPVRGVCASLQPMGCSRGSQLRQ